MLTFFRKIRRSLIDSGSARKYVVYAIGEILLVMIGILLALQVNNWNEWRKDEAKMAAMMSSLCQELIQNKKYLEDRIEFFETKVETSSSYLLSKMNRQSKPITVDSIIEYYLLSSIPPFGFKETAINRIISNEYFDNIKQDSFKTILNDYYREFSILKKEYENIVTYSWESLIQRPAVSIFGMRNTVYALSDSWDIEILKQLGRSQLIELESSDILLDPYFESYITWKLVRSTIIKERLVNLIEMIETILNFIDEIYKVE